MLPTEGGFAGQMPENPQILRRPLLCGLLIFVALTKSAQVYYHSFDKDEFQHLHAAWLVHSGRVPYLDFWENHTPLFYWIAAPLIGSVDQAAHVIFLGRLAILPFFALTAVFFYKLARLRFPPRAALLATVLFIGSDSSLGKGTEVRPEVIVQTCLVLALWLILKSGERTKKKQYLAAGLALGVSLQFAPVALLDIAALAAVLTIDAWRSTPSWKERAVNALAIFGGLLLPFVVVSAQLTTQNAFGAYLRYAFWENVTFPDRHRFFILRDATVALVIAATGGLVVGVRQWAGANPAERKFFLYVTISALLLIVLILIPMPAAYPQAALHYEPLLCLLAATFLVTLASSRQRMRQFASWVLLFLLLVTPQVRAFPAGRDASGNKRLEISGRSTNNRDLARTRKLLELVGREETLLDGNTAAIFRHNPTRFPSLVRGLLNRIRAERSWQDEIITALEGKCDWVLRDSRVAALPPAIQRVIDENFVVYPLATGSEFEQGLLMWRRDRETDSQRR